MKELSILFVIDGLWVGGTERSLADLLPNLRKVATCRVAALRHVPEGVESEMLRAGTDIVFLENDAITQIKRLRSLIKNDRPDIVHTALFRSNLIARLAAAGTGTRLVTSLVNTSYSPTRLADPTLQRGKVRLAQAAELLTGLLMTDHFHAVSNAAKVAGSRDLLIPARKISVVRRGRDPVRLGHPSPERKAASRRLLALDPEDPVVINVGKQDYQKDQLTLLRAIAHLKRDHPKVRLLLVGRQGTVSKELASAKRQLGIEDRVIELGYREDVPDILVAADVFAFPSIFEGFPGAILEAMALGLPVVASDIAPNRELIQMNETGLLVPAGDPSMLARALDQLLRDPDLRLAFGNRARELFYAHYTSERYAHGMLAMYQQICSGS